MDGVHQVATSGARQARPPRCHSAPQGEPSVHRTAARTRSLVPSISGARGVPDPEDGPAMPLHGRTRTHRWPGCVSCLRVKVWVHCSFLGRSSRGARCALALANPNAIRDPKGADHRATARDETRAGQQPQSVGDSRVGAMVQARQDVVSAAGIRPIRVCTHWHAGRAHCRRTGHSGIAAAAASRTHEKLMRHTLHAAPVAWKPRPPLHTRHGNKAALGTHARAVPPPQRAPTAQLSVQDQNPAIPPPRGREAQITVVRILCAASCCLQLHTKAHVWTLQGAHMASAVRCRTPA